MNIGAIVNSAAAAVLNVCDIGIGQSDNVIAYTGGMFKVDQSSIGFAVPSLSGARSTLWLPRAGLSALVRAVIARDTRGVALTEQQRYNHLPASPTCAISWYFTGEADVVSPGFPAQAASPRERVPYRVMFTGPFTQPIVTWNPGEMHAMVLMLMPDALLHLTGVDPGAYINRVVPVDEVLGADWVAMCGRVEQAADDDERVQLIDGFLNPLWQARRPESSLPARLYTDWSQNLAMRAATSGLGRSLRQVERRIKQWTGQPLRELRGLSRSERVFFDALMAQRTGAVNWSEVADKNGYSDQSHLCRQTLKITGFPPEELRRRIFEDESFWVYRLWGFSEQDPGE